MAGALDSYNRDVMATECPTCGVVNRRCKGASTGHSPQMSHVPRRTAAGYRWDKVKQKLEKLNDQPS